MKITMPENYIALFTTPTAGEAAEIIRQAETVIDGAARFIRNEDPFLSRRSLGEDQQRNRKPHLLSHVRPRKKFYATAGASPAENARRSVPSAIFASTVKNPSGQITALSLYGLYLPLSERSDRIRKTQRRTGATLSRNKSPKNV